MRYIEKPREPMEIDAEKYDGSIESVEKIRKLLQKE